MGGEFYSRDDLLRNVLEFLPKPVREETVLDGSTILIGGDPGEVVVEITSKNITISLYGVYWDGPYTPRVRLRRLAKLRWNRLPAVSLWMTLHGLIGTASEMRRARFKTCDFCKKVCPPEWMDGGTVCHSCQERELGIVH